MPVLQHVQRLGRRLGVDLRWSRSSGEAQFVKLLLHSRVDLVLDVGANHGQFAQELRHFGYAQRIVSFEPLSAAFAALTEASAHDPRWTAVRTAVGNASGEIEINVAANAGASSSILPMLPRHRQAEPGADYTGVEQVPLTRLDDAWPTVRGDATRPFLKLDVQGYEAIALEGAQMLVPQLAGIRIEMSLVPLYESSWTVLQVIEKMAELGFDAAQLHPGIYDRETGELLQADGVFIRR